MRSWISVLSLVAMALSLGAGRGLAAGAGVVVVGGGGQAGAGGGAANDQLKQVPSATFEADLVAVVKVTDVAQPAKKEDAAADPAGLPVFLAGGGVGEMEPDKLLTAEVTEQLKGTAGGKPVTIKVSSVKRSDNGALLAIVDCECIDASGGAARKSSQQFQVPFTLAKDKKSLVFLKVAEEKKDPTGKVTERTYKLIAPLPDGAPEKALAAVKDALKIIEAWNNPPKLSAEEQAAVEKLIRQMGDSDFATRDAATKALIAKGVSIKASIEAATKSPDAEIKQRSGQVLEAITPEALKPQDQATVFRRFAGGGGGGGGAFFGGGAGVIIQAVPAGQ